MHSQWVNLEGAVDLPCHYAEALSKQQNSDQQTYRALGHTATIAIYIDLSDTITPAMRVVYRGQVYPITRVIGDNLVATILEVGEVSV